MVQAMANSQDEIPTVPLDWKKHYTPANRSLYKTIPSEKQLVDAALKAREMYQSLIDNPRPVKSEPVYHDPPDGRGWRVVGD